VAEVEKGGGGEAWGEELRGEERRSKGRQEELRLGGSR